MALPSVRWRLRAGHGQRQLLRARRATSDPCAALALGCDETSGAQDDPENEQSEQVGVLASHLYLRRSIVTPTTKKNKAVPRTAAVQRGVATSPRKTLSSIPKTAIRTPVSRIASPIISATSCRSAIGPSSTTAWGSPMALRTGHGAGAGVPRIEVVTPWLASNFALEHQHDLAAEGLARRSK
jgi:hypothetical protein